MRASLILVGVMFVAGFAVPQRMPASDGSCSVTATGLESCDWWAGLGSSPSYPSPKILVTHYYLAPQAPLAVTAGENVVIVAMSDGVLLDEKQSPASRINLSKGMAMLIPTGENVSLRNVGETKLEVLAIVIHTSLL